MKRRSGFVSNSSSSSYVIVCPKADCDTAYEGLHPYYKAWVDERLSTKEKNFYGVPVIASSIFISTDDCEPIDYDGELPDEAEDVLGWAEEGEEEQKWVPDWEIISIYIDALRKVNSEIIVESEQM